MDTASILSQEPQEGGKTSTNLTFRFPMSGFLGIQHGEFLLIFRDFHSWIWKQRWSILRTRENISRTKCVLHRPVPRCSLQTEPKNPERKGASGVTRGLTMTSEPGCFGVCVI